LFVQGCPHRCKGCHNPDTHDFSGGYIEEAEQIMREGCIWGERHTFDNKLAFAMLRRLDRRAELGATFRTPPESAVPEMPAALTGDWQGVLDAFEQDNPDEASRLLAPKCDKGNEGNDPPFEGVEGNDSLDGDTPEEPQRVWQQWPSKEWRTDFPPPAGFNGDEYGDWEDPEGYPSDRLCRRRRSPRCGRARRLRTALWCDPDNGTRLPS
jgi:hypothetical protein